MTDAKTVDEMLREAINTILHYQFTHSRDGMHALQSLIDAAESGADLIEQQAKEIEALRSDAERYRWLRNDPTFLGHGVKQTTAEIDAAIDAAMKRDA